MTPPPRDQRPRAAERTDNDIAAADAGPTDAADTPAPEPTVAGQSATTPADSRQQPARPARATKGKSGARAASAKSSARSAAAKEAAGPSAPSAAGADMAGADTAAASAGTAVPSASSPRYAEHSSRPAERSVDAERPLEVGTETTGGTGAATSEAGVADIDRWALTPSAPAPDVVAGSAPAEAAPDLDPRDEIAADSSVAQWSLQPSAPAADDARDRVLAAYAAAAGALREAVGGLSADELRARRLDDGSSIARVLVHLADSELHGVVRMRRIVAEPGSTLQPYDHDRWLGALADVTSPDAALELFAVLRRIGAEMMRAATPAQRAQRCRHPEHGEVTLDLVLERHAEHAARHIGRIREAVERGA
jgi:hypothetical protein